MLSETGQLRRISMSRGSEKQKHLHGRARMTGMMRSIVNVRSQACVQRHGVICALMRHVAVCRESYPLNGPRTAGPNANQGDNLWKHLLDEANAVRRKVTD